MTADPPATAHPPSSTGRGKGWLAGRLSLGAVFGLGLGLLMLISVGSVLALSFQAAVENTTQLMRDKVDLVIQAGEERVRSYLDPVEDTGRFLQGMMESGSLPLNDRRRLATMLRAGMAGAPQIYGIVMLYNDLSVVRVGRQSDQVKFETWANQREIAASIEALKDMTSPGWLPPIWAEQFRKTLLVYHLPVTVNARREGTLILVIAASDLSKDISEVAYRGTTPFILYGRDRVLAHPALESGDYNGSTSRPLPTISEVGDPVLAQIWSRERRPLDFLLGADDAGHTVLVDDTDQVFVYRMIDRYGTTPWIVGLHISGIDGGTELARLIHLAIISIALLLFAVCTAFFIGRGMGRPLMTLAGAAEKVRGLDLGQVPPLPRSRFRELDTAATAFNAMVSTLRWFELYIPKTLVHRLLREGDAVTAPETREMTVMFTDIAGFTSRCARLGAADTTRFLDEHFKMLGACIDATEGTIDKYIGDSVMAFWGAPGRQPDHARRAARSALLVKKMITEQNARGEAEPMQVRIGISSGPVLVGNIGAPGRVNYTVVGEVVNLAQRFEQLGKLCAPDEAVGILMTRETAMLLGPEFVMEPLGAHEIRGISAPMEVYKLIGKAEASGLSMAPASLPIPS
ncbi:adenylate/guanylate cyclase domain-containing protein [Rhodoligotrophos ferricapiens]|uniref:adenylate/guanylate cyclase domain-containing protein n=1 Tax=Rhodoligotrophos ferricapiens TaxID=3069264 RepID=UPI00315D15DC